MDTEKRFYNEDGSLNQLEIIRDDLHKSIDKIENISFLKFLYNLTKSTEEKGVR